MRERMTWLALMENKTYQKNGINGFFIELPFYI